MNKYSVHWFQLYHMCDGLGRQFSYSCPNATLFQQRMLVCDHWYMVNCSRSEDDYNANLLIGSKQPFVDDSGTQTYHRTPRPDLLSHPSSESEFNIIYRNFHPLKKFLEGVNKRGRWDAKEDLKEINDSRWAEKGSQEGFQSHPTHQDLLTTPQIFKCSGGTGKNYKSSKNIVGIEPESQQSTYADEPTYFPPSHWSTEYPSLVTTPKTVRGSPNRRVSSGNTNGNTNYRVRGSNQNYGRTSNRNFDNTNYQNVNQNYNPSNYPTRTLNRNYDKTDYSTAKKSPGGPARTKQQKAINFNSSNKNGNDVSENNVRESPRYKTNKFNAQSINVPVNYRPSFRPTTTVFPSIAEQTPFSREAPSNNQFNSKATDLPVTPLLIEVTAASTEVPVNYRSNFQATTPVFPLTVESASEVPNEIGILPPIPYRNSGTDSKPQTDSNESESSYKNPSETGKNEASSKPESTIRSQQQPQISAEASRNAGEGNEQHSVASADVQNAETERPQVNFRSDFKATTPVYPTLVNLVDKKSSGVVEEDDSDEPHINFESNFKATTPVYPSVEEIKKLDVRTDYNNILETPPKKDPPVNFASDFKATTPVYPTSVEPTSPEPGEIGLLPPQSNGTSQGDGTSAELSKQKSDVPTLSLSIEPPKFDQNYKKDPEHSQTTVAPPSMFYQAPKLEPDYTSTEKEAAVKAGIEIENIMKSLSREQWQNLRQRFHIPEYDFPLDDATRPSYNSVLNSFAANPAEKNR
ncbi:hypothetical protein NQ318_020979 [Aromia moschata]|uniref:Chitin-binding type-2 domain-containing protein n=1 Tax=Aromia moschata TaxID=1265417 RepID=A0AAV8YPK7_9CUCU|nr:hypothetical protein NQ318_020979 [Aromia moschata]